MRRIAVSVLLSISVGLLVGCSRLNSQQVAEYNRMIDEKNQQEYEIDTNKIEEVIEFLVDADIIYKDYIAENEDKMSLLSDSLALEIRESAVDRNEEGIYSDVSNPDEELVSGGSTIGENDYPLYGSHYEIVGYGTKEESEESIKEFESLRDNTLLELSVNKNIVTAKIDNKYYGEYLIRIKVTDGKVTDFIKLKR